MKILLLKMMFYIQAEVRLGEGQPDRPSDGLGGVQELHRGDELPPRAAGEGRVRRLLRWGGLGGRRGEDQRDEEAMNSPGNGCARNVETPFLLFSQAPSSHLAEIQRNR